MDNFIYSLQATVPIFLLIILGKILYKIRIINTSFTKGADKFVFYVSLPALVFLDLTETDMRSNFDGGYVLFCFCVTLISVLGIWGLTELFMKNKSEKGAFIQASYRSSAAILGLAFITNMYSDSGMAPLMIVGSVPLYNIFAVVILTLKGDNGEEKVDIKTTIINICKNPILIGIFVGLIFSFLNWHFPFVIEKAMSNVAATTTPLALVSIGASFEGRKAIKKLTKTLGASFIKLVLLPILFLPLAIYLGYRNQELMAILIMLGSPTTVSSYIMAKNTGNDSILTSSVIVLTTLLSSVTLTLWIFLLKSLGML